MEALLTPLPIKDRGPLQSALGKPQMPVNTPASRTVFMVTTNELVK